ncbi:hypothetical protein, partial [Streptomyces sp. NPDC059411]|uniref:hypothetical protein n=1 Tax=Streptomyces sp. NPDC059411 TaxID=3346825 RepID=UPI0036B8E8E5
MTRPALRTEREAVRWTRLLLLAALLLGIVSMHTLGHPTQAHAMDDVPAVHFVPAAGHAPSGTAPDHTTAAAAHATGPEAAPSDVREAAAAVVAAAVAEVPRPHTGMDPMSVCLAVLGALTLLILGAGLAGAPPGGARAGGGGGGRRRGRGGGRPAPPPP